MSFRLLTAPHPGPGKYPYILSSGDSSDQTSQAYEVASMNAYRFGLMSSALLFLLVAGSMPALAQVAPGGGGGGSVPTGPAGTPNAAVVSVQGISGGTAVSTTCSNCSGSGVSATDKSAFTSGTSLLAPGGGFYQTAPTSNPLTNGQQGMWQFTPFRAGMIDWYNSSGTEMGTSGAPVRTDPTGTTTQPVGLNTVPTVANGNGIVVTQAGSPLGATNGIFANLLQGNAVLSAANPIFVSPGTGAVFAESAAAGAIVDGADVTQGAKADAPCTLPATTTACSEIAAVKAVANAVNSAIPAGTNLIGNVGTVYPAGSTPITASATGTTAATTATLSAAASKSTYVCGFSIRANATAAATGNATVTGTITATLNFTQWTAPNASGLGVTEEVFSPCLQSSAVNTAIAVISAAPGTGGVVSVSAWGFQL
jgi:hypothetical protein